jgi:hypothetical protein
VSSLNLLSHGIGSVRARSSTQIGRACREAANAPSFADDLVEQLAARDELQHDEDLRAQRVRRSVCVPVSPPSLKAFGLRTLVRLASTSLSTTTCLWRTIFMMEISFLICAPMFCFWIFSLSSTLMATRSSVSVFTAYLTLSTFLVSRPLPLLTSQTDDRTTYLPKVPSPSVLPISYLPTPRTPSQPPILLALLPPPSPYLRDAWRGTARQGSGTPMPPRALQSTHRLS